MQHVLLCLYTHDVPSSLSDTPQGILPVDTFAVTLLCENEVLSYLSPQNARKLILKVGKVGSHMLKNVEWTLAEKHMLPPFQRFHACEASAVYSQNPRASVWLCQQQKELGEATWSPMGGAVLPPQGCVVWLMLCLLCMIMLSFRRTRFLNIFAKPWKYRIKSFVNQLFT